MNNRLIYNTLLLIGMSLNAFCQSADALMVQESVQLVIDRNLYVAGEEIQFAAFVSAMEGPQNQLSKVLYAEIIEPDGKSLVNGKSLITNHFSSGSLNIPIDLISGIYYIRAYTRVMRNQGPGAYAYCLVKIVNPLVTDVLEGTDSLVLKPVEAISDGQWGQQRITLPKARFLPRETINPVVSADQNNAKINFRCVSVVPEACFTEADFTPVAKSPAPGNQLYYAETRGVSVTGEVRDKKNDRLLPGIRINLSIIGEGRDFMATQTDSAGQYYFSLPAYHGYRDVFICAETADTAVQAVVYIDNDFCVQPVRLLSPAFSLSTEESAAALQLARNLRITNQFQTIATDKTSVLDYDEKAFYGRPNIKLELENYVLLPTMEEYFVELPTMVKLRKKQGIKYFKVFGPQSEMTFNDPLVLVDWVAINNPEKVLAVSPSNVARIEVVNEPYVKGDITYGGIVSLISKRGDFAGIDLPSSGVFLNYLFYSNPTNFSTQMSDLQSIPDARNTLLWVTDFGSEQPDAHRLQLTAPDSPGKYIILWRELSSDGLIQTTMAKFEVHP